MITNYKLPWVQWVACQVLSSDLESMYKVLKKSMVRKRAVVSPEGVIKNTGTYNFENIKGQV